MSDIHNVFDGPVKKTCVPDERGLYPFDETKTCEKCGNDDIYTAYANRRQSYRCPYTVGLCDVFGEHIHRACRRCGYKWVENILIEEKPNASGIDAASEGRVGEAG